MTLATAAPIRIIDCHVHYGQYPPTKIIPADADSMVRVMDRAGVEKLCMSAFLAIGPDCHAGNELVAEAVRKYPDRLIGYAVVNPNRPLEIDDELRRCYDDLNLRAIKLHPMHHQYSIGDSAYRKVFEFAAKRRIPILSHEWGDPGLLDALSGDYPEINFIMAHVGFWDGRSDFRYADVMNKRDNIVVDLAYSTIFFNALEHLVKILGPAKIVFGSDFPLHDLAFQLGRLWFAKLPDEHKRMILGLNMLRVLGIE